MKILLVVEENRETYEKKLIEINQRYDVLDVYPERSEKIYFARVTVKWGALRLKINTDVIIAICFC